MIRGTIKYSRTQNHGFVTKLIVESRRGLGDDCWYTGLVAYAMVTHTLKDTENRRIFGFLEKQNLGGREDTFGFCGWEDEV